MASISLENVGVQYAGSSALDDVNVEIGDGEFFVLVGPSGCGKSTLLRLVAGLEFPTTGTISLSGEDVTDVGPGNRDIAMVFQNYAIYPHMTVRKNLSYGLRVRGTHRRVIQSRVEEVAGLLGLEKLLDRRPSTLSGGQLQRVAMGRAIARQPRLYLMDEPLSNLDAKLRVTMRAELERLHKQLQVTTVYVTHDQVEAMTLGQRAAVLRGGRVQQVGSPQELYTEPANAFIASFIGSPPMNMAIGRVEGERVLVGGFELDLPHPVLPADSPTSRVIVGLRPEDLRPAHAASRDACPVAVRCETQQNLGADVLVHFSVPTTPEDERVLASATSPDPSSASSAEVELGRRFWCARVAPGLEIPGREELRLAVSPQALHFFDPETGQRLTGR